MEEIILIFETRRKANALYTHLRRHLISVRWDDQFSPRLVVRASYIDITDKLVMKVLDMNREREIDVKLSKYGVIRFFYA